MTLKKTSHRKSTNSSVTSALSLLVQQKLLQATITKCIQSHKKLAGSNVTSVTRPSIPQIVFGTMIIMCIQSTCMDVALVAKLLNPKAL